MPDLQNLLDQIDRLDKEAEAGPWTTGENDETGLMYFGTGYCDCCTPPIPSAGVILGETGRAEAEFIALARTALPKLAEALRAVVERHKPFLADHYYNGMDGESLHRFVLRCDGCEESGGIEDYPCPTVQAITDQMGEAK